MRRLKRTQARHTKRAGGIKCHVIATSAATAFSLASQAGLAQLPKSLLSDKHQIAVVGDADRDLLTDREEIALGYEPWQPDQNRNGAADGAELALQCARVLAQLPSEEDATDPRQAFKQEMLVLGLETCDVCGQAVNMGVVRVVNPALGLTVEVPILASHYMEHGSFSYAGDVHKGRVEIARLARALGVRFPFEPDEHQLPLDHAPDSFAPVVADANDLDADLLADSEELAAGLSLYDTDQDHNLVPEGIQLARRCAEIIDRLPIAEPNAPQTKGLYKVSYMMRGLEWCEICGQSVNMGYWQIVDAASGASMQVTEIARHFMEHGSFSYLGTVHGRDRTNVAALLEIVGWPLECGDLGTTCLPGDLNKDCNVDAKDFADWADHWLASTNPDTQ
jgi:hypothetical protein